MPQSKRTTSGMGSIRKITREINGKTYTCYEARYTAGFDPRNWKADPAQFNRQDAKGSFSEIKSCFGSP